MGMQRSDLLPTADPRRIGVVGSSAGGLLTALLGERSHLSAELSPVTRIDELTPPTFVWTTALDPPGLPNALAWAKALAEHDVPLELHVYPEGPHGVGLADGVAWGAHGELAIPHTAEWTGACERWVRLVTAVGRRDPPGRRRG